MPAAEGTVKACVAIDRPQGGSDHARMPRLAHLLLVLLLAFGSTAALARQDAAPDAPPPTPAQQMDQLRGQLDDIKKALADQPTAGQLGDLRTQALVVQDQAGQLAASLAPQVQSVQAQLAVLGPAPAKGAPAEAAVRPVHLGRTGSRAARPHWSGGALGRRARRCGARRP